MILSVVTSRVHRICQLLMQLMDDGNLRRLTTNDDLPVSSSSAEDEQEDSLNAASQSIQYHIASLAIIYLILAAYPETSALM
uniref:Dymeclin n=1 Tax=Syphacia muris TaxID=451379 RepID=A0A0N5AYM4_9BILA